MTPLVYLLGGSSAGFAIALAVALLALRRAEQQLAARELADANALTAAERTRADVAERQLAAAEAARKATDDDADDLLADAIAHDGVVDPTRAWDRHAGGVPPSAATGAGGDPAPVPARGSGAAPGGPVAAAAGVPGIPAGPKPLPGR